MDFEQKYQKDPGMNRVKRGSDGRLELFYSFIFSYRTPPSKDTIFCNVCFVFVRGNLATGRL